MGKWEFALWNGGWWLIIKDLDQFFEYHERTDGNYAADFILSGRSKDGRDQKIEKIANLRGISCFEAAALVSSGVFKAQLEALSRGETLYINQAGGWNNCVIPELTIVFDKFAWPGWQASDIKVEQWADGYHWYAYVGNVQIKDGDTIKWPTKYEAFKAAMGYVGVDAFTIA